MKTAKWVIITIASAALLAAGCGTTPIKPTSAPTTAPAKQVVTTAPAKQVVTTAPAKQVVTTPPPKPAPAEQQDPWTYYNNAKWSDTFNGLTFEIEKVAVTDTMPKVPDDQTPGDTSSVVGVKFKMTNSTDKKFSFYPDQAKLVTSTGEQIDMPDLFNTTHLGGEIDGGVTKEGDIVWLLQRGHAEDVKWITMSFHGHAGDDNIFTNPLKEYEVKLTLK